MYVNTHVLLKNINYSIMFQTKKLSQNTICQNTILPLDICTNTGSVLSVITSVLSIDKYMHTCIMYDK